MKMVVIIHWAQRVYKILDQTLQNSCKVYILNSLLQKNKNNSLSQDKWLVWNHRTSEVRNCHLSYPKLELITSMRAIPTDQGSGHTAESCEVETTFVLCDSLTHFIVPNLTCAKDILRGNKLENNSGFSLLTIWFKYLILCSLCWFYFLLSLPPSLHPFLPSFPYFIPLLSLSSFLSSLLPSFPPCIFPSFLSKI